MGNLPIFSTFAVLYQTGYQKAMGIFQITFTVMINWSRSSMDRIEVS